MELEEIIGTLVKAKERLERGMCLYAEELAEYRGVPKESTDRYTALSVCHERIMRDIEYFQGMKHG